MTTFYSAATIYDLMTPTEKVRPTFDPNTDPLLQELTGMLNDYLVEQGITTGGSQPRYRYYQHPRKLFRYCWNTEPLTPKEQAQNKRWSAFMYKSRGRGRWQLVKMRYFAKRNSAKACALKWFKAAKARIEKDHQR